MFPSIVLLFVAVQTVLCQFPPIPEGVTTLKSKYHEGVTISYKEVRSLGSISTFTSADIA